MVTVGKELGIMGIVFNTAGAGLIAISDIMDENTITRLSQAHYDENLSIHKELVRRRRNSKLGLLLIVVGSGLLALGVITG